MPPGPIGWLTILPELVAVWKIQAQMVADIAAIYGKKAFLTREQMLYCLFRHMAAQAVRDFVAYAGERVLFRRVTLHALQTAAKKVGIRITQRAIGKGIGRWIPVLGALGVAAYAYYDTGQVAATAIDLFQKDIEIERQKVMRPQTPNHAMERTATPPCAHISCGYIVFTPAHARYRWPSLIFFLVRRMSPARFLLLLCLTALAGCDGYARSFRPQTFGRIGDSISERRRYFDAVTQVAKDRGYVARPVVQSQYARFTIIADFQKNLGQGESVTLERGFRIREPTFFVVVVFRRAARCVGGVARPGALEAAIKDRKQLTKRLNIGPADPYCLFFCHMTKPFNPQRCAPSPGAADLRLVRCYPPCLTPSDF